MSTVLEQPPKPEIFPSVNYFDHRSVGADIPRWVFFPGDLIAPERKAEISWLRVGGEETSCLCLQKYGRGFVPRGLAALLELGGEPIPMRHLGDLQATAWAGMPLNEDTVKSNLRFIPVYPGDGLKILRRYSMNDGAMRKGLDEIEVLRGKTWDECHNDAGTGILDVIERTQFGDGMAETLRELEDQIRYAKVSDTRIDYGKFAADELRMCSEFRNWAERKLGVEHGLLKSGHVGEWQGGWSYSYSPVAELLLKQLEIPRQDQPLQEMAKMVSLVTQSPNQPQGMSAADMDMIDRRFEEKLEQRLAAAQEKLEKENAELRRQLEAKTALVHACDYCGKEFDSPQGKSMHMTRHCTERPNAE